MGLIHETEEGREEEALFLGGIGSCDSGLYIERFFILIFRARCALDRVCLSSCVCSFSAMYAAAPTA